MTGSGGGFSYASLGNGRGIRFNGSPLHRAVPGQKLPSFGLGSNGIIRRSNIPNFNGMGGGGGGGNGSFTPSRGFSGKAPQIMRNLMNDFGLTKEQAAGVLGNLGHETGGFSLMQEKNPIGGGRGGYGWAQWTGPRRRAFEAWAKERGLDPSSDEANYGFLKHELMNTQRGRNALANLKKQGTASGAMYSFERDFEAAGIKHYGSRLNYTNQALRAFDNPVGAAVGGTGQAASNSFAGVPFRKGVDPRIQEIVNAGAKHLPEGYKLAMTSGFRGHNVPNHNGHAADYQIIGPDGKPLSNRGNDPTGMYQLLARHSYGEMLARYPELKGKFAWGGAFGTRLGGGGPRDLMHFDINGRRGRYQRFHLENMGPVPGAKYGITDQVPPAQMIQNVPSQQSIRGDASLGLQRSGGGPIAININGNSHDPEALATLVQRRIDESMNWRTHDTSSEYT